jgi:hypothetical protein
MNPVNFVNLTLRKPVPLLLTRLRSKDPCSLQYCLQGFSRSQLSSDPQIERRPYAPTAYLWLFPPAISFFHARALLSGSFSRAQFIISPSPSTFEISFGDDPHTFFDTHGSTHLADQRTMAS